MPICVPVGAPVRASPGWRSGRCVLLGKVSLAKDQSRRYAPRGPSRESGMGRGPCGGDTSWRSDPAPAYGLGVERGTVAFWHAEEG